MSVTHSQLSLTDLHTLSSYPPRHRVAPPPHHRPLAASAEGLTVLQPQGKRVGAQLPQ